MEKGKAEGEKGGSECPALCWGEEKRAADVLALAVRDRLRGPDPEKEEFPQTHDPTQVRI